ncbi:hypothetical protein D9611_009007 [Ephemerocybe angulata]|uniref:Uncharacterized protein n=1 Tax=Ephemerocybe angulata TaxID=980116 RepID=A0A8H5BZC3_9AGAR|nr:hypothetical protein D9611_009007 [Tulosesus angulatus]
MAHAASRFHAYTDCANKPQSSPTRRVAKTRSWCVSAIWSCRLLDTIPALHAVVSPAGLNPSQPTHFSGSTLPDPSLSLYCRPTFAILTPRCAGDAWLAIGNARGRPRNGIRKERFVVSGLYGIPAGLSFPRHSVQETPAEPVPRFISQSGVVGCVAYLRIPQIPAPSPAPRQWERRGTRGYSDLDGKSGRLRRDLPTELLHIQSTTLCVLSLNRVLQMACDSKSAANPTSGKRAACSLRITSQGDNLHPNNGSAGRREATLIWTWIASVLQVESTVTSNTASFCIQDRRARVRIFRLDSEILTAEVAMVDLCPDSGTVRIGGYRCRAAVDSRLVPSRICPDRARLLLDSNGLSTTRCCVQKCQLDLSVSFKQAN